MPTEPQADEGPSSETARIASDLMEMARQVCFHRRGTNNRRLKLTQYLDAKLRAPIIADYEEVQREQAEAKPAPPPKPTKRGRGKPPAGPPDAP